MRWAVHAVRTEYMANVGKTLVGIPANERWPARRRRR